LSQFTGHALLKKSLINVMEYQYYIDQVQNQQSGGSKPLETAPNNSFEIVPMEFPALTEIASPEPAIEGATTECLVEPAIETTSNSATLEAQAPASLEPSTQLSADVKQQKFQYFIPPWTDPGPPERALPLADAFTRRQHYVESLLTCCSATRQCSVDGDPLTYLRFRAKNESIMSELTNARTRFRGRVGRLSMPLCHKSNLRTHRLLVMAGLWFLGGVVLFYWLIVLFMLLQFMSLK
jgi:hypothetical protein